MNTKRVLSAVLAAVCAASAFAGCSAKKLENSSSDAAAPAESSAASQEGGADTTERVIHHLTVWDDNQNTAAVLNGLTEEYQKDHPGVTIENEKIAQNDLPQKIMILASSNSLPDIFNSDRADTNASLIKSGQIKNASEVLKEAGVESCLPESVYQGLANLQGTDEMWVLPTENNIEAIWYNKKIFEENGVTVPTTWDEFTAVCDTLKNNGVQPIALFAKGKWGATRWIANMTFRRLGVQSIVDINDGVLSMSDPTVVDSAKVLQDMNTKGYFGEGVNSVDEDIAYEMMLGGKAAMCYTGSWFTERLEGSDTIGEDMGLMAFPTFPDGKGSAGDYLCHYGLTLCIGAQNYDDALRDWIAYVFPRYGDYALENLGLLTPYTMQEEHETSYYTQLVLDEMQKVTGTGAWLEFKLPQKASSTVEDNVQPLLVSEITPEEYCQICDEAIKTELAKQ